MRVAFSGSGLLYAMHLGAYQSIIEKDSSTLTAVSGTSGGAIIAALLAFYPIDKALLILKSLDPSKAISFNPTAIFQSSFCFGTHIEGELKRTFGTKTFADSPIPIYITSSDVISGEPFVFSKETSPNAPIWLAVRASLSIPILYTPVKYLNKLLVDGGVLNPTPVNVMPPSNAITYGIRVRSAPTVSGYKGLSYLPKVISMLTYAVDNTDAYLNEVDDKTNILFLDVKSSGFGVFDTDLLFQNGYLSANARLSPSPTL